MAGGIFIFPEVIYKIPIGFSVFQGGITEIATGIYEIGEGFVVCPRGIFILATGMVVNRGGIFTGAKGKFRITLTFFCLSLYTKCNFKPVQSYSGIIPMIRNVSTNQVREDPPADYISSIGITPPPINSAPGKRVLSKNAQLGVSPFGETPVKRMAVSRFLVWVANPRIISTFTANDSEKFAFR